jgi:DNA-binding transcriptional LysR family regulator
MSSNHDVPNLHGIDLNLLVALDALTCERSVTRAAERAGVTQSAMSHTLRRLRELFDDPLLVRGRGRMVLTPRAEALAVPLRGGLLSLARTLAQPEPFEPGRARRTFRLVSPDLFDVLVLPALLRSVGKEAPGINLAVVPSPPSLNDSLETGEVDLAVYPVLLDPQPFDLGTSVDSHLRQRTLFRDSFRCYVRHDHKAASGRRKLSLERYVDLRHILVSPGGQGPGVVDRVLQARGLERRIALRVPHFSTALAILAESDLVLTAPASLTHYPYTAKLASIPTPIGLPEHAITMLWHPRFTEDPAHRWFRELLVEVTAAIPALPTKRARRRSTSRENRG